MNTDNLVAMRYQHDCEACVPLGHHYEYDLYFCEQGRNFPTLIARFGDGGPDYASGMAFVGSNPAIYKAYAIAKARNLITRWNDIMKDPALNSSIVQHTLTFATQAHEGQVRKYTGEPYIEHPIAVAKTVWGVGGTDELVQAALLHDVVEDTDVSIGTIFSTFGCEVAWLVSYLTDISQPQDGNREVRKRIDLAHIRSAPPEAKTIKLADLCDNSSSITKHDPNFAPVFMKEFGKLSIVLEDGNQILYERAQKILEEYYKR